MDKKGQGLTLNTIVIAILVVIVLVSVIFFFFGGFKNITDKIESTFFVTTAGMDESLAVETCRQYCGQAQRLPDTLKKTSAYCTQAFIIEGKSKLRSDGLYENAYSCSSMSKPNPNEFKKIHNHKIDKNLNVLCAGITTCVKQ